MLLGLLSESECRAAAALAACGIDEASVRDRWPGLARLETPFWGPELGDPDAANQPKEVRRLLSHFSPEVRGALAAIQHRLYQHSHALTLATEHVLLGLAASEGEVAQWLRARGIDPDALEAEIQHRSGFGPEPLPIEPTSAAPLDVPETPTATEPPSAPPTCHQEVAPDVTQPPCERVHVMRVIDAAANRGLEGLRVVEDYVRFVLDDRHLTAHVKHLRHGLAAALATVSMPSRLAARETLSDVGTGLATPSEQSRQGLAQVVAANFARLQQALRSLEEFGKLLDPEMAEKVKQLRYQTYTLHRAVQITASSLERLQNARLYVLIDGAPSQDAFAQRVRPLIEAGVHMLQLRDKRLDDRALLARARLLRGLTAGTGTLCIMNDRPDLATLAGADGVHLGQEDLAVKQARLIVGPDALIGVSTHSIEQARQAVLEGANYLGVGPVFPSGTKHFEEFPGLGLLRAVAAEIRLPAFAIGGIDSQNVAQVRAAGFGRIAVSGAIQTAPDPAAAARQLLALL